MKQLIAIILCLSILPLPALAAPKPQVSASYTGEARVGESLHFTLTGVNSPMLALQVVSPDSSQQFFEGAHISVPLQQPGLYVFIAYGANGSDPSAPGFERCMSAPIRVEAEGMMQMPVIQGPQQPGLQLYTTRPDGIYGYGENVEILWTTHTFTDDSHGTMLVTGADGNIITRLPLTNQNLKNGRADISLGLSEKPGDYQVEMQVYNTSAAPQEGAALALSVEKDPAMAFVDRIAYLDVYDYQAYSEFHRWLSPSKPLIHQSLGYSPNDYTNSGYLMLNRLLDEEYNYEDSQYWFPMYEGIMTGLKMDIGALFTSYAAGKAEGWGEQVFTDVLCDTGVYYIQNLMQSARAIDESTEAEEAAAEALFASNQLAGKWQEACLEPWLQKQIPLNDTEAENLKRAFGKGGGEGRKALDELVKANKLTSDDLAQMGLELTTSQKVVLSFKDGDADNVYRTLKAQGLLNDEAGQAFERAYLNVKKAQGKNQAMLKRAKALKAGGTVLSAGAVIYKMADAYQSYGREKQKALNLLLVLANGSEDYIRMLEDMLTYEGYWTDQQRGGVRRYIDLMKAAMDQALLDGANNLDDLAAQIAADKAAAQTAGAAYAAGEFIFDLFSGAQLLPQIAAKLGIQGVTSAAVSKASFITAALSLTTAFAQMGVESAWNITDKHDTARVMYAAELLIINSYLIIDKELDKYTRNPSPEQARKIIQLIQHHKALKLAGEEAAWNFAKIELNDVIYELYKEKRDERIGDFIDLGLRDRMLPEQSLTWNYDVLVNGQKHSVSSYLDLAYLYRAHGEYNVCLDYRGDKGVKPAPLSNFSELLSFLDEVLQIVDTATADLRLPFDAALEWINYLQIPHLN
ncbi:MAG: hypothetical protein IJ461_04440 [Clostridia bacterium]|nr:hypothetical protein [Clostridia bacterium]